MHTLCVCVCVCVSGGGGTCKQLYSSMKMGDATRVAISKPSSVIVLKFESSLQSATAKASNGHSKFALFVAAGVAIRHDNYGAKLIGS